MNEYRPDAPHGVILEERQRCSITGVTEVISFDETEIIMETSHGIMTIGGENLHVERLSLDIGELALGGRVDAIVYSDAGGQKKSFWGKFF